MSNQKVVTILAAIMAAGALTGGYLAYKTHGENVILLITIKSLEYDLDELQGLYSELEEENQEKDDAISKFNQEINDLILQVSHLNNELDTLTTIHQILKTSYSTLQSDYEELDREKTMIDELKIGNSLTSYYDYIRYEFGPTGTKIWRNADETSCKFAAQLVLHDLHELYWVKVEETYGEDVGQESYAQAWSILNKAIGYCGIDRYDSDTEKIEKILDFIIGYLSYESDLEDSFRAPVETLSLRSGDCDDYSILAAALFEAEDIDSAIGFFKNDEGLAHTMVLVHLEDLSEYGCWYWDDLTYYDLEEGRWIIIEPQYTIDQQDNDDLSEWKIYMAVEIDYEKVKS